MTTHDETHTVHDPFLNREVQISDKLIDRLRGRYACGPIMPNGEPEFGWREFDTPPISKEAASALEAKDAEIARLRNALSGSAAIVNHSSGHIAELESRISDLERQLAEIDSIVHTPTPSGEKATRHFQRDFDTIRKITAPYHAAAIRGGAK